MSYQAKIILDSISPTGKRLTTFEITFPRIVLAEFNTHRMFSRNSASSRAIPFNKQVRRVLDTPFIPEKFPVDGKGMQPNSYISKGEQYYEELIDEWLECRNSALESAKDLHDCAFGEVEDQKLPMHIHKQLANRLLEPFMWHTVIVTATEFDNFFKLRCDENAQYEIRRIADLMYKAYHAFDKIIDDIDYTSSEEWNIKIEDEEWSAVKPKKLKQGEWHCPLVSEEDNKLINELLNKKYEGLNGEIFAREFPEIKKRISVARCARISYLTHDGKRDIEKDLQLFERLRTSGHWSPFEHIATPYIKNAYGESDEKGNMRSGNFIGWKQYRKEFADENCTNFRKE